VCVIRGLSSISIDIEMEFDLLVSGKNHLHSILRSISYDIDAMFITFTFGQQMRVLPYLGLSKAKIQTIALQDNANGCWSLWWGSKH